MYSSVLSNFEANKKQNKKNKQTNKIQTSENGQRKW